MANKSLRKFRSAEPTRGSSVPPWGPVDPLAIATAFLEEQEACAQLMEWIQAKGAGPAATQPRLH